MLIFITKMTTKPDDIYTYCLEFMKVPVLLGSCESNTKTQKLMKQCLFIIPALTPKCIFTEHATSIQELTGHGREGALWREPRRVPPPPTDQPTDRERQTETAWRFKNRNIIRPNVSDENQKPFDPVKSDKKIRWIKVVKKSRHSGNVKSGRRDES